MFYSDEKDVFHWQPLYNFPSLSTFQYTLIAIYNNLLPLIFAIQIDIPHPSKINKYLTYPTEKLHFSRSAH